MCFVLGAGTALAGGDSGFCSRTAKAVFRACQSEVRDDFFIAKASCINESDDAERAQCLADARASRRESLARIQGQRWRAEARSHLNGLGKAIDEQFSRWNLTEAEREVALLLLKGLSNKEIAAVRAASERTVREQARSIKAGLTGRAALSAFFLEDMLAPIEGLK